MGNVLNVFADISIMNNNDIFRQHWSLDCCKGSFVNHEHAKNLTQPALHFKEKHLYWQFATIKICRRVQRMQSWTRSGGFAIQTCIVYFSHSIHSIDARFSMFTILMSSNGLSLRSVLVLSMANTMSAPLTTCNQVQKWTSHAPRYIYMCFAAPLASVLSLFDSIYLLDIYAGIHCKKIGTSLTLVPAMC